MRASILAHVGVSALVPVLAFAACAQPPPDPRPNIVVIVLDTARPHYLSVYGHPRPTSPFLEEFARAGTRFDRAYSVSSWTLPAHASLFSGLLPDAHGADHANRMICEDAPLLAERLVGAGYRTAGFSNNPWVAAETGLARGFQYFERVKQRRPVDLASGELRHPTVQAVRKWFGAQRRKDAPFFLFVNLIEPHLPYKPPWDAAQPFFSSPKELEDAVAHFFPEGSVGPVLENRHYSGGNPLSAAEWDLLRRLYEAELRLTDAITDAIVSTVDQRSHPNETLVFLVSDHGENLGDHGHVGHIFNLYDSNLRILCLARGPGFAPGTVRNDLVQIVDLYPTILRAAGLEPESNCAGVDLLGEPSTARTLEVMLDYPHILLETLGAKVVDQGGIDVYRRALVGAIDSRFKGIRGSDGTTESFDLTLDPDELSPLAEEPRSVAEVLARPLGPPLCAGVRTGPDFDGETLKELQALGYVDDASAREPSSGGDR